jgi:VWFA-related protein
MMRRALVTLATGLVAATALAAAQQTPTFRSTSHLVRVDVVVTDPSGNPITGLVAGDFTLSDRGARQPISTFDEIHHSLGSQLPTGHHDVSSNVTTGTGQLLVLVLDDTHIRKEWSDHARTIVENFVRALSDDTMVALLSSSGRYNVEVTNDRQRVLDALEQFTGHEMPLAYSAPSTPVRPPGHVAWPVAGGSLAAARSDDTRRQAARGRAGCPRVWRHGIALRPTARQRDTLQTAGKRLQHPRRGRFSAPRARVDLDR